MSFCEGKKSDWINKNLESSSTDLEAIAIVQIRSKEGPS